MAFNLDDYEPVAARLERAWAEHPDMRVITELVHYLADTAVFKAEIWLGTTLVATGWAEEIRGQGNVNRTSHLENCETGAVGRALANMGYSGSDPSKRPSREEMDKVQRNTPVERGIRDNEAVAKSIYATQAQKDAITRICKAKGKTVPAGMDSWTKGQASQYMDILMGKTEQPLPEEEPF